LVPALPRFLTWGVPIFLFALLGLALVRDWNSGNPLDWARARLAAGFTLVGQRIEPELTVVTADATTGIAPVVDDAAAATATAVGELLPDGPPAAPPGVGAAANSGGLLVPELVLPTPTPNGEGAGPVAPQAAAALPTATIEPPTATLPPSPTAEPTTPTVAPTIAPTAIAYVVRAGDTLITIAARHEVEVDEIMTANDISERDVYAIQPGQILVIPVEPETESAQVAAESLSTPTRLAAAPTATPSPTLSPTPSPAAPRVQATAAPTVAGLRLNAPLLRSPADGATLGCDETVALTWERTPQVRDDDSYMLHLGFVSGRTASGQDQVTWIFAQPRPVTQTSWPLQNSLCGLAPQQYGRQGRWWVEVVAESDGEREPVSPPSEIWGFTWE
jgi:LysM repeat protein